MEPQNPDPRHAIFRRLTFYSVLGGLCPLIPAPFVDDWALGQVQRRMLAEVARHAGVALSASERRILAGGGEPIWRGCLGTTAWALREVIGAILKWLFRTVFYFLTIRRSVRRSAETLHLGYLFDHALRTSPAAPASGISEEDAVLIRAAAMKTLEQVDDTAIHRTLIRDFRRSLSLLLQAAALFRRFLPRRRKRRDADLAGEGEVFRREEELLGGFVDRLSTDLWGNQAYFAELQRLFEANLKAMGAQPHAGQPR